MIKVHRFNGGIWFEFNDYKFDRLKFIKYYAIKIIQIQTYTIPLKLKDYFINNKKGQESYFFSRMKELGLYYDINQDLIRPKLPNEEWDEELVLNIDNLQLSKFPNFDKMIIEPINGDLIRESEYNIDELKNQNNLLKEQINNQQETINYLFDIVNKILSSLTTIPAVVGSPLDISLIPDISNLTINKNNFKNNNDKIINDLNNLEIDYEKMINEVINNLQKK